MESRHQSEIEYVSSGNESDDFVVISESSIDPFNRIGITEIDDLDSSYQKYNNIYMKDFLGFLHDPRKTYTTNKGDKASNIINQKYGKNYIIPDGDLPTFFQHYENCRLNKCGLNYAEKQGSEKNPYTGIMLDYDCQITTENFELTEQICYRLVSQILRKHLVKHIVFTESVIELKFFFIVRPQSKKLETGFKSGFHILIPGLQTTRSYKKYLINSLSKDATVHKLLKSIHVTNSEDALDFNSASVPTLFLGSCKPAGLTYILGPSFNVTLEFDDDEPSPLVSKIEASLLKQYNLSWELSLNYEARYQGKDPLVTKKVYKVKPELENEIVSYASRAEGNRTPKSHLDIVKDQVDELRQLKPQANDLCNDLELLPESSYTSYSEWMKIIFAIANTSEIYYPIALWFSQKCPDKYSEQSVKQLWDQAIQQRYDSSIKNPVTHATIKYLAKKNNPERFLQTNSQNALRKLSDWVWKYNGSIDHYNIAKILYMTFSSKFKVDIDEAGKGFTWYQFIMPGDRMEQGEIWKWRQRKVPLELYEYISEGLEYICDQVKEDIRKRLNEAENEEKGKKLNATLGKFINSSRSIFNHTFKNNVIKECEQLFIEHGFVKKLDKNGDLFGCGNGIIQLGNKCKIISKFHEHTINKFSPVKAIPFDPKNPMTKKALDMFRLAIPEKDARIKLMMFWASCLDGWAKDPELAILTGVGGNAKTTTVQCINKVFGEYGLVMNAQLLTKDAASADKPNSQIAAMEAARMVMMEETNRDEAFNPSMVKKLVNPGDISNRDLHAKQKTFKITSKITLITNHKPKMDIKDGGLKRRLFHYRYKCRFVHNPEPNSYQRKDDPRFIKEYPDNPEFQSGLLSVLVYFYEILQTVYEGNLKKVPSPTIDRETEEFFNEHDHLGEFVKEKIVHSPDAGIEYSLNDVAIIFKTWLSNVEDLHRRAQQSVQDIVKDIEESIMIGKYIETAPNGVRMLKNCRILENDGIKFGESYISHIKKHQANQDNHIIQDVDDDWWVIPEYEKLIRPVSIAEDEEEKTEVVQNDDRYMRQVEKNEKVKEENEVVNDFLSTLV